MSEKLKPNFTPVPNVILDEIMRGLNEGEFKTLMAICRYTYGWGKQSDQISLNQLAEITGMNRSNVARARKRLGSLVEVTPGTATTASTYRLNIEISDAELKAATIKGSDPSATSDRSATSVKGSDPSATFQRKPKKEEYTGAKAPDSLSTKSKRKLTRSDPVAPQAFERFYQAFPKHVGRHDALKAWLKLKPDDGLIAVIMMAVERYAAEVRDTTPKFILHPATWLNGRRWEDEPANGNGNGHVKPVQVKDLGNGMLEVDGRVMDQRTYERRYGQTAT